jgi:hypothetical protein
MTRIKDLVKISNASVKYFSVCYTFNEIQTQIFSDNSVYLLCDNTRICNNEHISVTVERQF